VANSVGRIVVGYWNLERCDSKKRPWGAQTIVGCLSVVLRAVRGGTFWAHS
jgi:hypothetical protein